MHEALYHALSGIFRFLFVALVDASNVLALPLQGGQFIYSSDRITDYVIISINLISRTAYQR